MIKNSSYSFSGKIHLNLNSSELSVKNIFKVYFIHKNYFSHQFFMTIIFFLIIVYIGDMPVLLKFLNGPLSRHK